jgi:deoxyribose-phosphate aldolase
MPKQLRQLAKMIDHSLLHPTLREDELLAGCKLAAKYEVASVCIKPYAVLMAGEALAGTDVKVGTVIGFPHGSSHIEIKCEEAVLALAEGAEELDMVVNVGKVLSGDWDYVSEEINILNDLVVEGGAILKVIFENDYLVEDQYKIKLCQICNTYNVAFVKTSTGYGFVKGVDGSYTYKGATDHDLILMRKECNLSIQIKAAGGVRTLDDLLRVKSLGVTRVGATATAIILEEAKNRGYQ